MVVGAVALLFASCSPEEQQRCGKVAEYGIDACGEYYVALRQSHDSPTGHITENLIVDLDVYNTVEVHDNICLDFRGMAYKYNCPN